MFCLVSQDTCKNTVESTHLKVSCTLSTHQSRDTFFHLARCLVGKCKCKNLPRGHALLQQPGYLIGKDSRLSRTCTCYYKTGPVAVFYCLALTII